MKLWAMVLPGAFCLPAPLRAKDDFLQTRGAVVYLHGKVFYEISFEKFDLFLQLLAGELGRSGYGRELVVSACGTLRVMWRMFVWKIRKKGT